MTSTELYSHQSACCADNPGNACSASCSLCSIDELLSTPGAVTGEEVDLLLDFRHLLRRRENADAALGLFCELRRRLELRHYLALYRIRRWLENHVCVMVRPCPAAAPVRTRLTLTCYCIEAVRRASLCSAVQDGVALLAPRLHFEFLPVRKTNSRKSEPAPAFQGKW